MKIRPLSYLTQRLPKWHPCCLSFTLERQIFTRGSLSNKFDCKLHLKPIRFFSSEIDTFVNLTHLLKMVSIPARIVEKSWEIRFPASKTANPSRISKAAKRRPGRPPKSSTTASTLAPTLARLDTEQSVTPPTKVTRSGRKVVPRRLQDEIVGDVETADVLGYSDEVTGIVHGSVKSSPHSLSQEGWRIMQPEPRLAPVQIIPFFFSSSD